mgnify:CR=1 FL=1
MYRLTTEILTERINERSETSRQLLTEDLKGYDASVDADSVAEVVSKWIVEIVQNVAGLVPQNALQKQ